MIDKKTDQFHSYNKAINESIECNESGEFEVVGAGKIRISKSNEWMCGGVTGFDFSVSWGRYGYAGGVLSRVEAAKLITFLQSQLSGK